MKATINGKEYELATFTVIVENPLNGTHDRIRSELELAGPLLRFDSSQISHFRGEVINFGDPVCTRVKLATEPSVLLMSFTDMRARDALHSH